MKTADAAGADLVDAESSGESTGRWLLVIAYVLAVVAGLRGVAGPWEDSLRGLTASMYIDPAVHAHLEHGFGLTLGVPAYVFGKDPPTVYFGWHHPPLYTLCITAAAWLFGNCEATLRLAHLIGFLPCIAALYAMLKRTIGARLAGVAVLSFASSPMIGYFGPMVMQTPWTLSAGLMAMWAFDRHLAAPSRGRWLATAALFFFCCCMDVDGYFWGLAMFLWGLVLVGWRRAFRVALSLVPVALLAVAAWVLHYGMVLGGVRGFFAAFRGLAAHEGRGAHGPDADLPFAQAARELFLEYGSLPLFAAALLGLVAAWSVARSAGARRRMWLGVVLLVPGIINYFAFLPHALRHAFWSMSMFAGLALLATSTFAAGVELTQRPRPLPRRIGIVLIGAVGLTVGFGAIWTHVLVSKFSGGHTGPPPVIQEAGPLLEGCSVVMTSLPIGSTFLDGDRRLAGGIDSVEMLELMLSIGKANAVPGEVAFVLPATQSGSPLARRLDRLAAPQRIGDLAVYRFRAQ